MAGMMLKLLCLGLMCMVLVAPYAEGAISCSTVYSNLYPCMNYATGTGELTANCCNGVRTVYANAGTTSDRRTVCTCLKQVASSVTGVNVGNLQSIPGRCGVKLSYSITPSIDCAKVQ